MALLKASILSFASLTLLSCGFMPNPTAIEVTEAEPTVYAILSAGSNRATVLIDRLKLVDGQAVAVSSGFLSVPVKGASVTLTVAGEATQLLEGPSDLATCGGPSRSA